MSRGQSLFRPIFLGVNKNLDVSGQIADPDGSGTAVRGNDMQPASSPGQKRTLKRIQKEFFLPRSKEKKCENFLVLCAPCLAKHNGGVLRGNDTSDVTETRATVHGRRAAGRSGAGARTPP